MSSGDIDSSGVGSLSRSNTTTRLSMRGCLASGSTGADQSLGFEDLNIGFAQMLGLGIEQPAIGAANTVWSERLFQIVGLEENRETR